MDPETTDNLEELLDIVDVDDNVIGAATRRECNSNPLLIHRAAYLMIYNSKDELFLHQRSMTKDTCPGMWSISVAGHVEKGESYEKTIVREMEEEIGVALPVEFLDKILLRHVNENEFAGIFRGYAEGPFSLNPEEIARGYFFGLKTIRMKMWQKLTPFSQMVINHFHNKYI